MVSIIIPCFNGEKYIKRCLDSVISQDYKDIEVILINDGSTDGSHEIIKSYKDTRIKYFKKKNQGIGKTRNFGISKANGEFIMFLDIDDYLDNKAVSNMTRFALDNDLDLVVTDYYVVSDDVSSYKIKNFGVTSLIDNPDIILDINLAPWGKLYKSDLIKDIKFEEKLKYEDAPFVVKSIVCAKKIGKLNYCSTFYTINEGGETTVRDEKVFDIIKIVDIIRGYLEENNFTNNSKKLIVKMLTNYTIQQRYNKNPEVGERFIEEAFNYLKEYVPDYRNSKYYLDRTFIKEMIEKSEILTKFYVKLYQKVHKI